MPGLRRRSVGRRDRFTSGTHGRFHRRIPGVVRPHANLLPVMVYQAGAAMCVVIATSSGRSEIMMNRKLQEGIENERSNALAPHPLLAVSQIY